MSDSPEKMWNGVFIARAWENSEGDVFYELAAMRSDNIPFQFQVMHLKGENPKQIVQGFIQTLLSLESYRNCECVVNAPCKLHEAVVNPYRGQEPPRIIM